MYCIEFVFSFSRPVLQIDENVAREIINHRSLRHPNIIRFKEVRVACGEPNVIWTWICLFVRR
jgi:hypothetical protein